MPLDRAAFEQIVHDVVTELPAHIRTHLEEVAIVIEERPPGRGRRLLGLYEGVPLTEWGRDFSGKLPDKITLFQEPIEAYALSPQEIPAVIRETLLHEIAHFLGFEHDHIHTMEKRWRKKRPSGQK